MKAFISNDYEILTAKLLENLQKDLFPLKKIIVTPASLTEKDFIKGLKNHTSLCGFKVMQLHSAIDYILRLLKLDEKFQFKLPTPTLLAFHIECVIWHMKKNEKTLDETSLKRLKPLLEYLDIAEGLIFQKRVKELAFELSQTFQKLGCYGSVVLQKFLVEESWQKLIWDEIYSYWSYLYLLDKIEVVTQRSDIQASLHFFCFPHIPKVIDRFLMKLTSVCSLYYYSTSPSMFYFGDALSDKQRFRISNALNSEKKAAFQSFTQGFNPLLSNWGKIFSDRQNFFSDESMDFEELYLHPIKNVPASLDIEKKEENFTLLSKVKTDLLYMGFEKDVVDCQEEDLSFQLHICKTKYREVENLKMVLLNLIEKEKLQPEDIGIYAPDISSYYPYLKMIFEKKEPKLPIHVEGLSFLEQSPYLKALLELFSLKNTRFSKTEVMKLFHYKAVKGFAKLSKSDMSLLDQLFDKAQIRFGFDKEHKEKILSQFSSKTFSSHAAGSWDYGLKRLIFGLSTYYDESVSIEGAENYYPIQGLSFTQSVTLGRFIEYIYDLYEELKTFSTQYLEIEKWCEKIKVFAENHLKIDEEDKESHSFLLDQLKVLSNLAKNLPDQKLPFSFLENFLKKAFNSKVSKNDTQLNKIFVSSLSLGSLKPFKALALMGMDETFPKLAKELKFFPSSSSLMDPCFTSQDEGRHLALESLLMAKQFYIVSYSEVSSRDNKEVALSSAFEELLDVLDEHYTISGVKISEKRVFQQSVLSFDKQYFEKEYPFEVFEEDLYKKAKIFYQNSKKSSPFIDELYKETSLSQKDYHSEIIPIHYLRQLLSNPLNFYFKQALGIFFKEEISEQNLLSKELFVSSLQKYILKKDLPYQNEKDLIYHANMQGIIPDGIYQELAQKELLRYESSLEELCTCFDLELSDFWIFKISPDLEKIEIEKEARVAYIPSPKIEIDNKVFRFCGDIENITKKGLFFPGRSDPKSYLKIWADYLIYVLTLKPQGFENALLFGQSGISKQLENVKAEQALSDLMRYFFICLNHPSPLLPPVVSAMMKGSSKEIKKAIDSLLSKGVDFLDPCMSWFSENVESFCAKSIEKNWTETFKNSFSVLSEWENA